MVKEIKTKEELETLLCDNQDKLIVIDFFATWCGPCTRIAPKVHALSESDDYKEMCLFLKVDVDHTGDISEEYGIQAMPTFLFFKDGQKCGQFVGANVAKLKATIDENLVCKV